MIEEYIFKTIISFISLKAVFHLTKENWSRLPLKGNGFIKRNFNALLICLIPVIRWIMVVIILIIGIALSNDKLVDDVRRQYEKKEVQNNKK